MSWKKSTIGNVLSVIKNGINCEQNKIPIGYKITRIETIAKRQFDFDRVGYANLTENEKERSKLKVGDILFSHINSPVHVGKTAIYQGDKEIYHGINLLLMRTNEDVNPYFFNYFLNYLFFTGYWKKKCKQSVNQASVNQKDISKVEFSYPSLSIQQSIVAKFDKIFAEIDKASGAAETNVRNTKDFLNNFISEKLNEKNGKNFEFKKIIEVLTDYHANGSYKVLKKNVEIKSDKSFAWMVRSTDFENNFQNNFRYIDKKAYEFLKKSKIFGGEILMCKIGNAGEVYLMPKISSPCSLAMNLFLIRVNKNICITKFVYYFLISNNGKLQIFNKLKGATTKTITKENVKSLKIPLVDLETQKLFVKKIEEIEKITNNLIKKYNHKIDLFNILRNSILNQAFNGELAKVV